MLEKRKRKRGIGLLLVLIVTAAIYLVYDSAHHLQLSEYDVSDESIPVDFDGFKLVQLSDLHGAELDGHIADMVRAEKPDIIVLTGDFISSAEELPAVEELLREITTITDVYFISGNHDFASGNIEALSNILSSYGVRYLRNEYLTVERGSSRIILAGVEDPNSWAGMIQPDRLMQLIAEKNPDTYTVLLGHRNYWMTEYPDIAADLILCGHAHGGIIRLPGVGGLISTDRTFFPDYDAGMYDNGSYKMIVSRGIGNSVSIPRINNRPEVVSITLHVK